MVSVFLDFLKPLLEAKNVYLTEYDEPSAIFNQLRTEYNNGAKGIENCVRLFIPNPIEDEELFEYVYYNKDVMKVVRWANRSILLKLGIISYMTLGVHLRIVCSMLTSLKEHHKLREDVYHILHSNLTKNALDLHYQISTEHLPFLP